MPKSKKQTEISAWLKRYFEMASESRPNEHVCDVHTIAKEDVYKEYVEDLINHNKRHLVVDVTTFIKHWNVVWSNHVARSFSGITSHCDGCYQIRYCFSKASDRYTKKKCKEAQMMHRSGFSIQKGCIILIKCTK